MSAGVVICLERGANTFHMVQLMSLPPHHLLLNKNCPDFSIQYCWTGIHEILQK